MLVFGSMMHIITLCFIILELCMLCAQVGIYLIRPQDQHRRWYIILLSLLILYTTTCSLFPDPNIAIPVKLQNIIAFGSGFTIASYFPYYFYKAFKLTSLSFHVKYGVLLFIFVPYIIFFIIIYLKYEDLAISIKYGIIIPFIYSIVLLYAILRAIHEKFINNRDRNNYFEELAVFCAIIPWSATTIMTFYKVSQPIEMMFTNSGFIVVSVIFIRQSIARANNERVSNGSVIIQRQITNTIEDNFIKFNFTRREAEVVRLLLQGLKTKEIGDQLNIAERTVTTHLQHIFDKAGVSSKIELFHELDKDQVS